MRLHVMKTVLGLCATLLFAANVQAGCGSCGGCNSGSACATTTTGCGTVGCGGAADCGTAGCGGSVGCGVRTVMQSQYVTETRMVPQTTYQRQTRTRMR